MGEKTKTYFISDTHLGFPDYEQSLKREKILVQWLDFIGNDAKEIYLLGDIFDFWYEYKRVVPRGFVRFLGKLARLSDSGIPIHYFTGNHDIWVYDYLPKETGVVLHRSPVEKVIDGKLFFIGHGDGLGPYDRKYKMLKALFTNPVAQWLFSRLHPNFALWLGNSWSHSRRSTEKKAVFMGDDKEWLILYAKSLLEIKHYDYFVFGHRHLAVEREIEPACRFFYLGDWITNYTYGVFDGEKMSLKHYP